jgi:uncharacterized protein YacL
MTIGELLCLILLAIIAYLLIKVSLAIFIVVVIAIVIYFFYVNLFATHPETYDEVQDFINKKMEKIDKQSSCKQNTDI